MSRLTQARAGIPSAKKTGSKVARRGRKRWEWFVGDMAKRAAHDGRTPLVRDWREGEPLIRCKP